MAITNIKKDIAKRNKKITKIKNYIERQNNYIDY